MKDFLKRFLFFSYLTSDQMDFILKYLDRFELKAGDILFEEGDAGDFVCFVLDGGLEILKYNTWHDETSVIAMAGQGNTVGEMALMDRTPRFATVRAVSDTHLAILTQRAFDMVFNKEPKTAVNVLRGMVKEISQNLRETSCKLAEELAV